MWVSCQQLCLTIDLCICLLIEDGMLCNGDVQDTDSKSVDMESISEQKGQFAPKGQWN